MDMSEPIKCIIIEDEKPAAEVLELYLSRIDFIALQGTFGNVSQALPVLNAEHIDLIFLDINLPGINGITFVKSLHPPAGIIFTTAYTEYAVEGFELEAVDYLVKPISFDRFIKAVNKFLKTAPTENRIIPPASETDDRSFLFIKCERRMTKIYLDEILYFEAQKNYVDIVTEKEKLRTYLSISEMEEKVPGQMFLRVHRSFIVSLRKIVRFSSTTIEIGSARIPIGRLYNMQTMQILTQLKTPNTH